MFFVGSYFRMLLAIAAIPAIVLMIYIYQKDRIEKEPPAFLFRLFLLGCLSGIAAGIIEWVETLIINHFLINHNTVLYKVLVSFALIGLAEEGVKHNFLRRKTWNFDGFNCSFDAVVYASFIALGFAVLENVNYVFAYGAATGILRAVTSVPGHMMFAVVMGAFYAKAKESSLSDKKVKTAVYEFLSMAVPVILHGFFDFVLMMQGRVYTIIFTVYIAVMYIVIFLLVKYLSKHDHSFFISNVKIDY